MAAKAPHGLPQIEQRPGQGMVAKPGTATAPETSTAAHGRPMSRQTALWSIGAPDSQIDRQSDASGCPEGLLMKTLLERARFFRERDVLKQGWSGIVILLLAAIFFRGKAQSDRSGAPPEAIAAA